MERHGSGGASALSWQLPEKLLLLKRTHTFSFILHFHLSLIPHCLCVFGLVQHCGKPLTTDLLAVAPWPRNPLSPLWSIYACVCASYLCIFTSALLQLSDIFKSSNGRRGSRWSWDEGRGDKCNNANQHTLVSNRLFCFSEQYVVEQ